MHGSLLILVTPFSQACEHDVLLSVVKWGEAQVLQNMADQGTKSFNYIVTCCFFLTLIISQMGNTTSGKSRGGTLATTLFIGQTKAHRVVTKLSFSSLSPLFLSVSG